MAAQEQPDSPARSHAAHKAVIMHWLTESAMQEVLRTPIVQQGLIALAEHTQQYASDRKRSIFAVLSKAGAPGLVRT